MGSASEYVLSLVRAWVQQDSDIAQTNIRISFEDPPGLRWFNTWEVQEMNVRTKKMTVAKKTFKWGWVLTSVQGRGQDPMNQYL